MRAHDCTANMSGWTLVAGYACVLAVVASEFGRVVPEPYMDELFHVRQAQNYCLGRFHIWDDKITTLPGLYLVAVAVARLYWLLHSSLRILLPPSAVTDFALDMDQHCSLGVLRGTSTLFALVNVYLLYAVKRQLSCATPAGRPTISPSAARLDAVLLSSWPPLVFFAWLFYTDQLSLAAVLACWLLCLRDRLWLAAAAAAAAVLMRQTNVVWVAFAAAHALLRRALPQSNASSGWLDELSLVVRFCWSHLRSLLLDFGPFGLLAVVFGSFVMVNGGIVVGDRTAHAAGFHFAQGLYFVGFSLAWLVLDLGSSATSARRLCRQLLASVRQDRASAGWSALLLLLTLAAAVVAVDRFSEPHPYLLADNRHYTFYLWKNFFARWPLVKRALLPVYGFAFWIMHDQLRHSQQPRLVAAAFWLCTAAVLWPAPLVEFRYYIVPWLVFRLLTTNNTPASGCWSLTVWVQLIVYASMNAVIVFVFLYRPFRWPSGETARFMW
eukprot:TRINITY_DN4652_c0_g1_i1.p1 TRINITY_DN4652_c0_g1~~TRINITY_DN4652_c0_g1_i1.p1  ORF type:complete len:496 (+),score=72.97 TRINITY_DN4652_c0_g1_i1:82-1569(+)